MQGVPNLCKTHLAVRMQSGDTDRYSIAKLIKSVHAMEKLRAKTPQELGISEADWVRMAEELLYFRDFAMLLPNSPLGCMYGMRVEYLERLFGLRDPIDSDQNSG
mgnify:CR=1 FL=1